MFINGKDLLDDKKTSTIQQWIDNMPFFVGAKDLTSRFLLVSNCFAQSAGMKNSQVLKGRYDNEINCQLKQLANLFMSEDALVTKKIAYSLF